VGGDAAGEALGFASGDADELALLPAQLANRRPSTRKAAARLTAGIIYLNGPLRMALRFRYDPAPEAGTALTPRSLIEGVRNDGRHLLSVLFYVVGGILRTLNLAEVTSHLV
jgi:hypothetical protein